MKEDTLTRKGQVYRITLWGCLLNFLLLAFKFIAGIMGGSAAMVADAVHSLSDFLTDIMVIFFVRVSDKPEDESHDYGHGKFETLGTALIGIVLMVVGIGLFVQSSRSVIAYVCGESLEAPGMLALGAAVVSIAVKEMLYRYTMRWSVRLNSKVMAANAWHHRSDALSSIGTLAGIGGAILLGPSWHILDPLAALVVSVFIVRVAFRLSRPCIEELLECSLPAEEEEKVIRILLSFPQVSSPHHLRTRRIGSRIAIDVHIRMDGNMSLSEAHRITQDIEHRLKSTLGEGTYINIHMEPYK